MRLFHWPLRDWPRYLLHNPPAWLWRLIRRLPSSWICRIANHLEESIPGLCWATVAELLIPSRDEPWSGVSAAGCRGDIERNDSCWCGKYQSIGQWQEDMAKTIADPWDEISASFD